MVEWGRGEGLLHGQRPEMASSEPPEPISVWHRKWAQVPKHRSLVLCFGAYLVTVRGMKCGTEKTGATGTQRGDVSLASGMTVSSRRPHTRSGPASVSLFVK